MHFVVLLVLFIVVDANAETMRVGDYDFEIFPGAELNNESVGREDAPYRVVLGALEKINNQLEPERSEIVRGRKSSYTYYLPQARRTGDVGEHFEVQLTNVGQIVFECEGRTCGSSSYWANRVFDRAILYGPEQFQKYYVAKLKDDSAFLAVYIGQRATRKIYVHVELVTISTQQLSATPDVILAALSSNGRYVIKLSPEGEVPPEVITNIQDALSQLRQPVVAVAHDSLLDSESLDAAVQRTSRKAQQFIEVVEEAGDLSLESRGVGPLAPSDAHGPTRIELIVLVAP